MPDKLGLTWWDWFKLWKGRDKMIAKLGSRKLWAMVAGAALTVLGNQLGIDESTTTRIVQLVIAYIIGQGLVDAAAAAKGKQ